jgi:CO/xanthine dehydrogenase Mo-binding subunit
MFGNSGSTGMTSDCGVASDPRDRLGAWFDLSIEGIAVLKTGKVELGQGILLALRQIAAEELDLALAQVETISGDTAISPFEAGTVGSMSVESSGPLVRRSAAELRHGLFAAAAMRLQAPRSEISATDGHFYLNDEATSETYWTVAKDVRFDVPITGQGTPKSKESYAIVGSSPPTTPLLERIGGGAYIHDIALNDMLHGRVIRKPHLMARLESIQTASVEKLAGVVRVIRENDLVGVIADSEHSLELAALKLERRCVWQIPPSPDTKPTVLEMLEQAPSIDAVIRTDGIFESDQASTAESSLTATYTKPLIAHGSIGPSCGVATVSDDQVEVWTHSQNVFALQEQLSRVLEVPLEHVRVRHKLAAGCYGHNGADDAAMDAAILASKLPGRTVRVQWSRRDELTSEPLGSPMRVEISAALTGTRISAWKLSTRSGTHIQRPGWNGETNLLAPAAMDEAFALRSDKDLPIHNGGSKNAVALYDFPQHITYQFVPNLPFRLSALRSLGAFANVFSIESFMDELADAAGVDSVEFRLAHLSDERAKTVIQRAAEMAKWTDPCPPGLGRGLGFARFKNTGTYCAVSVLVAVEEDVELRGMWAAVDAGLAINPAGIIAQTEGGMLQAASWVLKEAVPTNGSVLTAESWKDYPILSFSEVPEISVDVIAQPDCPSTGVGEASLGPTAGAIANAVASALGIRIRDLPLTRNSIITAMMGADG